MRTSKEVLHKLYFSVELLHGRVCEQSQTPPWFATLALLDHIDFIVYMHFDNIALFKSWLPLRRRIHVIERSAV